MVEDLPAPMAVRVVKEGNAAAYGVDIKKGP
jgi:hypothetical protein